MAKFGDHVLGPAVLAPPRGLSLDTGGVADHGQAHVVGHHELSRQAGGPVAGQLHHPTVPGLGPALRPGQLLPPPRTGPASLAGLGPQRAPLGGHLPLAGLLVFQVQELLGPDGAARDKQGLVTSGDGQGVDDSGVDAGHFLGDRSGLGHRHPGGHVRALGIGLPPGEQGRLQRSHPAHRQLYRHRLRRPRLRRGPIPQGPLAWPDRSRRSAPFRARTYAVNH